MLIASAWVLASGFLFRFSEEWWTWLDRIVYIVTLWIAILVQGAQNRDTEAMQRKLDELIHSIDKADNRLEGLEEK
jgi:low affinity Fe/Cu permease